MNMHGTHRSDRRGAALTVVLIMVVLVPLAVAALLYLARSQVQAVERAREFAGAKMISEGGANQAYSVLATNFAAGENPGAFPRTAFAGGAYDVTVQPRGTNRAAICATGVFGRAVARTVLDVARVDASARSNSLAAAYGFALVAGDSVRWSGSGLTLVRGGRIHTNGRYRMAGSGVVSGDVSSCVAIESVGGTWIDGNAQAPVWEGASPGNVSGVASTQAVALVPIPDIDLTPYYRCAASNGQVISGSVHWSGSQDIVVPGGVLWVNGDFTYSGSGRIRACIIATGDVRMTGSGDQEKVGSYPALVSRDGDVRLSGSGATHGLIYAKHGNVEKSGGGALVGSIVCAGGFSKSGGWDLLSYEDSTPVSPGQFEVGDMVVVVEAWQD